MIQVIKEDIKKITIYGAVKYIIWVSAVFTPVLASVSYLVKPLAHDILLSTLKENGLDPNDLSGLKAKTFEIDRQTDDMKRILDDSLKQSVANGKDIDALRTQGNRIENLVDTLLNKAINR